MADALRAAIEAPAEPMALFQIPNGDIVHRVAVSALSSHGEPFEVEHDGYVWRWSHRRADDVIYVRGRSAGSNDAE